MQQQIPQDRLSRVYSYDALGSYVCIPIGLSLAGPLSDILGVGGALVFAGLRHASSPPGSCCSCTTSGR